MRIAFENLGLLQSARPPGDFVAGSAAEVPTMPLVGAASRAGMPSANSLGNGLAMRRPEKQSKPKEGNEK